MNGVNAFFGQGYKEKPKPLSENTKLYLIHCYLYYVLNSPVVSDSEFDLLCKNLLEEDSDHPLISKEDLRAGTGYSIKEYPKEIIEQAEKLLKENQKLLDDILPEPEPEGKEGFDWICTYLLLGLYIDYGYSKLRDKQELVQKEIQKRWDSNIDRGEFEKYFESHNEKPEKFKLVS
jgi:hypothetical protein